jgi:glycosyltransferase involved in cell wall biosynthesis
MRIAVFVANFDPGGVFRINSQLVEALRRKGHQVQFISATNASQTSEHDSEGRFSLGASSTIRSLTQMRSVLMRGDFEIVIVSQLFLGLAALLVRPWKSSTAILSVEHSSLEYWKESPKIKDRVVLKLSKLFLGRVDQLVAVSRATTQSINDQFFRMKSEAKYVPNAVLTGEETIFEGRQIQFENRQGIIFVGRLAREKRVLDVIRAYAPLVDVISDNLVILGDGPDMASSVALVEELGLAKRVQFKGFVENVDEYLASSKCLVLASSHEGLATVIIEALAYGCLVVSTDCPTGPREITKNGRYGQLVEVGDVEALSQAIKIAAGGELDYEGLAEHLLQFTVANSANEYENLCLETISLRTNLLTK